MAKLILTQEVTGLGTAGDVVEVKNGYARNYLLPRGFALTWTRGGEKQVESIRAARKARAIASLADAQALAAKLGDNQKLYAIDEAIQLIKDLKSAKFDETLEVALNLGVDPRHADQMVRGMVTLPSGTGKDVKVAVFARGDKAEALDAAREAVQAAERGGQSAVALRALQESARLGDTRAVYRA